MPRTPHIPMMSGSESGRSPSKRSAKRSRSPIREPRNGADYEAIYNDRREEALYEDLRKKLAKDRANLD